MVMLRVKKQAHKSEAQECQKAFHLVTPIQQDLSLRRIEKSSIQLHFQQLLGASVEIVLLTLLTFARGWKLTYLEDKQTRKMGESYFGEANFPQGAGLLSAAKGESMLSHFRRIFIMLVIAAAIALPRRR